MDYYKLFHLDKEPFSNTPDPDFFFRSTRHAECLQKLEIAIRLKRGLCIVHGEVGTGKTTLCRQLVRTLSEDEAISVHMVLDPGFDQTLDFARTVTEMLAGRQKADACSTIAEHKESIKQHLFEAGVDHDKTTVLIIDEGQKLEAGCAEFLRELLNYETNREKLLQIVIFAQDEIRDLLSAHPNFADRAALCHHLKPLDRKETARLIHYRLQTAGSRNKKDSAPKFTRRGISRIHRLSKGYPRKIVHLGHNILLLLLVKGESRVTPAIVSQAASSLPTAQGPPKALVLWRRTAGISAAAALMALIVMAAYAQWPTGSDPKPEKKPVASGDSHPAAPAAAPKQPSDESAFSAGQNLPASLGWVRINKDEKLWHMLERIYGMGSEGIVEKVKAANPGLRDPNRIRPGQKIRFPVLGSGPVSENSHYWIAWKESDNFNQVYQFVFDSRDPDLRVLSFWHPSDGMRHAAVNRESFARYSNAEQEIRSNGQAIAGRAAGILDLSGDGVRLLTGVRED